MKRVSCFLLTIFIVFVSVVPTFAIFDGPDIFDEYVSPDAIISYEPDFVSLEDFLMLDGNLPYVNLYDEAIYPTALNQWSYTTTGIKNDSNSISFNDVNLQGPASGYSDSLTYVTSGSGPISISETSFSYCPLIQTYCAFPSKPSATNGQYRRYILGTFVSSLTFDLDLSYSFSSPVYGIGGSFYFGTRLYYGSTIAGATSFATLNTNSSSYALPDYASCLITFDDGSTETVSMTIGSSYSSNGVVSIAFNEDYYFGKRISDITLHIVPHFMASDSASGSFWAYSWSTQASSVAGRLEFDFVFRPNFTVNTDEPPFDYESTLTGIQDSLKNIQNQLTSSGTQNSASQGTLSKMEELMQQIEELNQTITNNTNRPNPSDVVTGLDPSYFNPTDPAAQAGLQGIGSLMSNSFLISLMLMVLTLALMRYILFGKR